MDRLLPFVLLLVLSACSEESENVPLDFGYDYFPLEVGKYRIYQVDSVIYDPKVNFTAIDSSHSQMKEEIAGTFVDNSGAVVYRVERSFRPTADEPWQISKVFVQSVDEIRAFQIEDNLRVIKMTFPLRVGEEWNANVFFDSTEIIIPVAGEAINLYKDWSWKVLSTRSPLTLGNLSFSDVATFQLSDSENLIEQRRAFEQYASGIGLIYRELNILDTQCQVCCNGDFINCGEIAWGEKAEKGFSVSQQLIEYN